MINHEELMLGIKIFLGCWFLLNFDPLKKPIENFFLKTLDRMPEGGRKRLLDGLFIITMCFKCLTFWTLLIFTLNPFLAIIGSMLAQAYQKKFMR